MPKDIGLDEMRRLVDEGAARGPPTALSRAQPTSEVD